MCLLDLCAQVHEPQVPPGQVPQLQERGHLLPLRQGEGGGARNFVVSGSLNICIGSETYTSYTALPELLVKQKFMKHLKYCNIVYEVLKKLVLTINFKKRIGRKNI